MIAIVVLSIAIVLAESSEAVATRFVVFEVVPKDPSSEIEVAYARDLRSTLKRYLKRRDLRPIDPADVSRAPREGPEKIEIIGCVRVWIGQSEFSGVLVDWGIERWEAPNEPPCRAGRPLLRHYPSEPDQLSELSRDDLAQIRSWARRMAKELYRSLGFNTLVLTDCFAVPPELPNLSPDEIPTMLSEKVRRAEKLDAHPRCEPSEGAKATNGAMFEDAEYLVKGKVKRDALRLTSEFSIHHAELERRFTGRGAGGEDEKENLHPLCESMAQEIVKRIRECEDLREQARQKEKGEKRKREKRRDVPKPGPPPVLEGCWS